MSCLPLSQGSYRLIHNAEVQWRTLKKEKVHVDYIEEVFFTGVLLLFVDGWKQSRWGHFCSNNKITNHLLSTSEFPHPK